MSEPSTPRPIRHGRREGVVLVTVLYFLVVSALVVVALFFVQRAMSRGAHSATTGAQLLGAAERAAYDALAEWDGPALARQSVGATMHSSRVDGGTAIDVYITRLSLRLYSIIAQSRTAAGVARRVELVTRVPYAPSPARGALVSAVNVTVGSGVRIGADTGACGDSLAVITLAPGKALSIDPGIPASEQPLANSDSAAADSATYLHVANSWWSELTSAADVQLPRDAHVTPTPTIVMGECVRAPDNWGEPIDRSSACASRVPVIFAPGDLTIDGGVGQGVLLVDGHLVIAGAFTFSGQIVVRHGLETRADNIAISGTVAAWRESVDTTAPHAQVNEVMLTRMTTLRYSRCDADHGIASWLQPRRVRDRAFAELF